MFGVHTSNLFHALRQFEDLQTSPAHLSRHAQEICRAIDQGHIHQLPQAAQVRARIVNGFLQSSEGQTFDQATELAFRVICKLCFDEVPLRPMFVRRPDLEDQASNWTCGIVATNASFVPLCRGVLSNHRPETTACLFAIRNLAFMSPQATHNCLLELVPLLLAILNDPNELAINRAAVCVTLQNMSLSNHTRSALTPFNIMPALGKVVRSGQALPDGGLVSASTALANLITPLTQQAAFDNFQSQGVVQDIVQCLEATINQRDFPPQSKVMWDEWEIASAVCNLSRYSLFRPLLVDAHAAAALEEALSLDDLDSDVLALCLESLWNIFSTQ
eukprot:c4800_g1_i2.p1 GENE.c4800_g1_i2~~c4800_g1_i2.p1  ORF type:complete len:353 (+),score=85.52 c4800_g1_i2:65-1060(+)